jgi:hypothetical protein
MFPDPEDNPGNLDIFRILIFKGEINLQRKIYWKVVNCNSII